MSDTFYERTKRIVESDDPSSIKIARLRHALDDSAESERWHYPADGDVPGERVDVLTCRDREDGKLHHNIECRYDCDWCGLDRWRGAAPTRWRYLSPADVPEAP